MNIKSWSEFWENDTTYACKEHKKLVEDLTIRQQISLVNKNDTVLDFGCGESFKKPLSDAVKDLYLYGDAAQIIKRLKIAYEGEKNIHVIDELDESASYSVIFVCSVIQYLSFKEFIEKIKYFKRVLKPDGKVIISDIIPKNTTPLKELHTLITIAIKHNFFIKSIFNILRMARSDYGHLRKDFGLSKYDKEEMIQILQENGFRSELHENIGLNKDRFCIISSFKS